jgi:alpha-L-rhamnosidase
MLGYMTNGIISRDQYGDWCVPPDDPKEIHTTDPTRLTGKEVLATTYFYYDLGLMERYAKLLGKTEDAARFAKLAADIKTAFNTQFLNRERGEYDNGTETSSVLPLMFGMVPDDMHDEVFQHLVDKINNESHGHIGTGLIGGQFLNRVLSDNGRADLAYTIATQTNYPGWGYMVEQGATTIWELWNGNTADPAMNSDNHVMLVGDLVTWLYEDVAGIAPDEEQPGFKHIIMKPQPVGDLKYVKATHRSPYGLISSEWHDDGKSFDWQIEVPANTTATVYVPASSAESVREGRGRAIDAVGVKYVGFESGRTVFTVTSGKYHFLRQ